MADFIQGQRVFHKGQEVQSFYAQGSEARFAFGRGEQILPRAPEPIYGMTKVRCVNDAEAYWFEFGWTADVSNLASVGLSITGNAAAGWVDSGGYVKLEAMHSSDLQTWSMGKFIPAPVPVVDLGGGVYEFWGRCTEPIWWNSVLVDHHMRSARYGKSITSLTLHRTPISLPGYPYAMPSQAATLQADLRSAGFTGAVVSSTSAALTATAANHTPTAKQMIRLTMSGTNVTAAEDVYHTPITSGMSYPYSMPSQRALLQTHLRNAGQSGAVVMLWDDEWQITLPDIAAADNVRDFTGEITPGDPFPAWYMFGNYLGEIPATGVVGDYDNLRDPLGNPLVEHLRAFARLKLSPGPRYAT